MELFDSQRPRLYVTSEERAAFLEAAHGAERELRTLCLALALNYHVAPEYFSKHGSFLLS